MNRGTAWHQIKYLIYQRIWAAILVWACLLFNRTRSKHLVTTTIPVACFRLPYALIWAWSQWRERITTPSRKICHNLQLVNTTLWLRGKLIAFNPVWIFTQSGTSNSPASSDNTKIKENKKHRNNSVSLQEQQLRIDRRVDCWLSWSPVWERVLLWDWYFVSRPFSFVFRPERDSFAYNICFKDISTPLSLMFWPNTKKSSKSMAQRRWHHRKRRRWHFVGLRNSMFVSRMRVATQSDFPFNISVSCAICLIFHAWVLQRMLLVEKVA